MPTTKKADSKSRIVRGPDLVLSLLCLLPFAAGAAGEWVLAGGKNDGSYRIYVRDDVKPLPNSLVEAWEVWDYSEPQSDSALKITYRSRMWLQSFDCGARSAAALSLTFYSGGMGTGRKLHSMDRSPDRIRYVRPAAGSPGEFMVNKVCSWVK
jgi:hypothetical protein